MRLGRFSALVAACSLTMAACEAGGSDHASLARRQSGVPAGAGDLIPPPGQASADPNDQPAPAALVAPQSQGPQVVMSPQGVVMPVLERRDGAWLVSTPCGREAVLPTAKPLGKTTVVLDAGHGGYDPGAVGPNGVTEAELNLAVSEYAKAALERSGVSVVLTRTGDYGMNLVNRGKVPVALDAKAFVSIHHNAAAWGRSTLPGTETYYQVNSGESKRLGGLLYEEILRGLSAYPVPWVSNGAPGATWRTRSNGSGEDYFAMVRYPGAVPAVLAEMAYISNPAEASLLADPAVQKAEGEAVARGIMRFLTTSEPGSGFVPGGQAAPRNRPPGTGGKGGWDNCDDPDL